MRNKKPQKPAGNGQPNKQNSALRGDMRNKPEKPAGSEPSKREKERIKADQLFFKKNCHTRDELPPAPVGGFALLTFDTENSWGVQEAVTPVVSAKKSVASSYWKSTSSCTTPSTSKSWANVASGQNIARKPHLTSKQTPLSSQIKSQIGKVSPSTIPSSGSSSTSGGVETEDSLSSSEAHWDTHVDMFWPTKVKTPEELVKEKLQKRFEKTLSGWPWRGDLKKGILAGPLFLNTLPFAKPQTQQTSAIFRAFKNADIKLLILTTLLKRHETTWKFSALCQETFHLVSEEAHMWDVSYGYFQGCETFLPANKVQDDQDFQQPCYEDAPVNVVASFSRPHDRRTLDHYQRQLTNLSKLTISVSNWADVIQTLQLHRVPFLTHEVLSLIVPQMRNLKALGIFKCQLIHVGHTEKLLGVIKTDRPLGKETQVSLDFYPNFHKGPEEVPGDPYQVGSFGVTWDEFRGINMASARGIWCLVARALPQARAQGVDFESEGTMFRKWLDDGPCFAVKETLGRLVCPKFERAANERSMLLKSGRSDEEALAQVNKCEQKLATLVASIDAANPDHRGKPEVFMADQKVIGNRPNGWKWMLWTYKCMTCKHNLLGIFFQWNDLTRPGANNSQGVCLGCHLTEYLDQEQDHLKLEKRNIIKEWLCNSGEWNLTDFGRALKDFDTYEIMKRAADLDVHRQQMIQTSHDPEFSEQQVPRPQVELARMYASRHWALEVFHKNHENPWGWCPDTSRRNAHGM